MMFGGENDFDAGDASRQPNTRSDLKALAIWAAYLVVGGAVTFGVLFYEDSHRPLVAEASPSHTVAND